MSKGNLCRFYFGTSEEKGKLSVLTAAGERAWFPYCASRMLFSKIVGMAYLPIKRCPLKQT